MTFYGRFKCVGELLRGTQLKGGEAARQGGVQPTRSARWGLNPGGCQEGELAMNSRIKRKETGESRWRWAWRLGPGKREELPVAFLLGFPSGSQ